MFQKPFKIKSHTAIKGTDRKKLRSDVSIQFPNLTTDQFTELIPNKSEMSCMKLCTHSGSYVTAYFLQKNPVFFEVDKIFYPTVYTLWQLPDMIPKFTTWSTVFDKLNSGADLMLPGIVIPSNEEYSPKVFGNLRKGDLCSVNLNTNGDISAPIAVGVTALSSQDMFLSGKRGKGVLIKHTYLDQLWAQGEKTHPPSGTIRNQEIVDLKEKEINEEEKSENVKEEEEEENEDEPKCVSNSCEKSPTEVMDDLLSSCFLHVWKLHGKKIELPLLTSTFYKNYMIPVCPKNLTLDVKKSSYKKLSKFLQSMQESGIIHVKELSKGVESIVGVNLAHSDVRRYDIPLEQLDMGLGSTSSQSESNQSDTKYEFPHITELYMINADVVRLFKSCGFSKGSTLTGPEVRQYIKNYVLDNQLQDPEQKMLVSLDDTLRVCLHCQEMNLKWDELSTRLFSRMSPAYQLKFKNQDPVTKKGKIEPIHLSISKRAANKKVTLINNLHIYNIDPNTIAHALQIGVAASTCVSPAPNRKEGQEVLVQGNQIKFIARLLLDEYKVPSKYIKGLELAPKQNKKR